MKKLYVATRYMSLVFGTAWAGGAVIFAINHAWEGMSIAVGSSVFQWSLYVYNSRREKAYEHRTSGQAGSGGAPGTSGFAAFASSRLSFYGPVPSYTGTPPRADISSLSRPAAITGEGADTSVGRTYVGYRLWTPAVTGQYLSSLTRPYGWSQGENTSSCDQDVVRHRPGIEHCSCGFYSTIPGAVVVMPGVVWGVVEHYGEVITHLFGHRSTKARIVALGDKAWADLYEVPYIDAQGVIHAFEGVQQRAPDGPRLEEGNQGSEAEGLPIRSSSQDAPQDGGAGL